MDYTYLPYDFRKHLSIQKKHKQLISDAYAQFAAECSQKFSSYFKVPISLQLSMLEQMPFSQSLRLMPVPTFYAVIDLYPLQGSCILEMSPMISYQAISAMLGGEGDAPAFSHALSNLEMAIHRKFINLFIDQLQQSCQPLIKANFTLTEILSNPESIQAIQKNESCLFARFDMDWNSVTGTCTLVLPCGSFGFEYCLPEESQTFPETDLHIKPEGIDCVLKASLGKIKLSGDEFQELHVGDILTLNREINDPIDVTINQKTVFQAVPGIDGKYKAIVIRS